MSHLCRDSSDEREQVGHATGTSFSISESPLYAAGEFMLKSAKASVALFHGLILIKYSDRISAKLEYQEAKLLGEAALLNENETS
ncbi:hypothetical protein T265_09996 [Opisthorchis viverrini]|uniref:Uncharacterized protein n=1 Tax=Opisthorchis viverrini TaxID=6198 RepID=A0A075A2Z8_OPIVI|nr:hypothetical protein T265_09996 [Opisthorchis viverrini]KER21759.1 hypothetical protein T265_09996 [Opisthorchis viverrini]